MLGEFSLVSIGILVETWLVGNWEGTGKELWSGVSRKVSNFPALAISVRV
jgi:hypothetical protein